MSENVLMCFKSEKTWKNPLRVWLKFVNTCSKVYSPQNYVGILTWEKPYKFQLNQRTFSRDNFRYVRKHFMHFVWNTWMNLNEEKPSCVSFIKKTFSRSSSLQRNKSLDQKNIWHYWRSPTTIGEQRRKWKCGATQSMMIRMSEFMHISFVLKVRALVQYNWVFL